MVCWDHYTLGEQAQGPSNVDKPLNMGLGREILGLRGMRDTFSETSNK